MSNSCFPKQKKSVKRVVSFSSLQMVFMPGFIEDHGIVISASTLNCLQYHMSCSLWKLHSERLRRKLATNVFGLLQKEPGHPQGSLYHTLRTTGL